MTGPPFDLSGRAAPVAGGSKGPGRALARGFAGAGADVVIASRHEAERRAAAGGIGGAGRVAWVAAGLSRRGEVERPARGAGAAFGRVHLLADNAGTNDLQPVGPPRDEDRDRLVAPKSTAEMAPTRALAPGMRRRGWGGSSPSARS